MRALRNSISVIFAFVVLLASACGNSISYFLVLAALEAILYPEFLVVASGVVSSGIVVFCVLLSSDCVAFMLLVVHGSILYRVFSTIVFMFCYVNLCVFIF